MTGFKKAMAAFMAVCMMGVVLAGCGGSDDGATETIEGTAAVTETEAIKEETTSETAEEKTTEKETEENTTAENLEAGTNMSEAVHIDLEQEAAGTVEAGTAVWYAFTTGDDEKMDYRVLVVNTTSGDSEAVIDGYIYNELGEPVVSGYNYAYSDGKPMTMTVEKAPANTTYYICLNVEGYYHDTDYTVVVKPIEE